MQNMHWNLTALNYPIGKVTNKLEFQIKSKVLRANNFLLSGRKISTLSSLRLYNIRNGKNVDNFYYISIFERL